MPLFLLESIILLIATVIFYIVFFSLSYYWHETKISFIIIPLLYTFQFLLVGFFIIVLLSLVWYLSDILRLSYLELQNAVLSKMFIFGI